MNKKYHFARPALAAHIAQMLTGPIAVGLSSDGLFIGGERRIGKTAFLINDLVPDLERRGYLVIYIDLTLSQGDNTGSSIGQAFANAKRDAKGSIAKAVKKITPAAINANVFGVGGGLNFAKNQDEGSMLDAFYELYSTVKKPIALIIDEAQRAMTNKLGQDALWALKSTRDQIKNNSQSDAHLLLIFTGSNRAKLADMVTKKDQAFFGSSVMQMPYLGSEYIDDLCNMYNKNLNGASLDSKVTNELFIKLGKRPAILNDAIGACILSLDAMSTFNERLAAEVTTKAAAEATLIRQQLENLPILARLVLSDIANDEVSAPVFSTENIAKYKSITGKKNLSTASIQAAIEVLIKAELVWKSNRGVYKLEEPSHAHLFSMTKKSMIKS